MYSYTKAVSRNCFMISKFVLLVHSLLLVNLNCSNNKSVCHLFLNNKWVKVLNSWIINCRYLNRVLPAQNIENRNLLKKQSVFVSLSFFYSFWFHPSVKKLSCYGPRHQFRFCPYLTSHGDDVTDQINQQLN